MMICATVLEVNQDSLLVRNNADSQEIIVRKPCVCRFKANDRVGILYNGIMTMSIPPQINASKIFKMPFNRCF